MILVHTGTKKPVAKGETVTCFRGENSIVESWEKPRHSGSTGRVYVRHASGLNAGYYPSVFGLKFVEAS